MAEDIVIRDISGGVINIGPWEYDYDKDGIAQNPLPDGATEQTEAIVTSQDGGRYAATDPRKNRKSVKENIKSLEDRIDALEIV